MPDLVLPVTPSTLLSATVWVVGFVVALFALSIVLPGPRAEGFALPGGGTKRYKLSGLVLYIATHVFVAVGTLLFDLSLAPLLTHFWSVFIVANALAIGWLLVLTFVGRQRRPAGPTERSLLRDLWFGAELNPTFLGVDLKMFAYQPSLIGLQLIVWAFAFAQFEKHGAVELEMWLYQAFVWGYLFTHYLKESFMLSTWDIIAERFGFMLVWGDLVYVPFVYSLVGWFVIDRAAEHGPYPMWGAVAVAAFYLLALWVFRGSNWQKDRFKRDPKAHIWGRPAETIGGKLLVSGFWGIGRKINYTGEICVYLSFALCAGFTSVWPYVLPLALLALLSQRAGRDDRRCREKYGALWDEYCARARFRIIPFLY